MTTLESFKDNYFNENAFRPNHEYLKILIKIEYYA